ncbi:MAG: hypothetical protein SH817_04655 [Leptospira sp.]|nr:hypothetical protein [Leptospira sp.]
MNSPKTETWNRILVRFLLAFAFWEAISIPLRMLFFSKFYFDPSLRGIFVPVSDVYWIGPIAGDLIQTLFLAILYVYARPSLPNGLVGGILFGIVYAITANMGVTLVLTSLTNVAPTLIWWVWAGFQTLYAIIAGSVFSIGWDEED